MPTADSRQAAPDVVPASPSTRETYARISPSARLAVRPTEKLSAAGAATAAVSSVAVADSSLVAAAVAVSSVVSSSVDAVAATAADCSGGCCHKAREAAFETFGL